MTDQDNANPYDAVYNRMYGDPEVPPGEVALRQSMLEGVKSNPDQAAKALPIAEQHGVPLDVAQRNMDALQKDSAFDKVDYKTLYQNYPTLSKFLSNPDNASLSHDDVGTLQSISDHIDKGVVGVMKGIPAGLVAGVSGAFTGIGATATRGGELLAKGLVKKEEMGQAGIIDHTIGQTAAGVLGAAGDVLNFVGESYKPVAEYLTPAEGSGANKVGETVGQFMPWIAATMATGGEAAMPYLFGASGAGSKLEQEKAEGTYDTGKGDLGALLFGIVNGALGSKGVANLTHGLPPSFTNKALEGMGKLKIPVGSTAEQWLTKALDLAYRGAVGATQMGGIQLSSNATDKYLLGHPDKALTEGVGEQAGYAGVASLILGSLFHVVGNSPTMFDEARAKASQDYLKNGRTVIQKSKLMERSPEKMNDLINQHTGGSDVHVNPEALNTFYQSLPPEVQTVLDAKMPDLKGKITDGLTTRADVPVNQADFMTYIQPIDRKGDLDDWTKLMPDHMTAGDLAAHDEFMKNLVDGVQEDVRNLKNRDRDAADAQSSIYDQLLRFTGVGRTPSAMVDVAKIISENPAKFMEVMSQRTGGRADVKEVLNRLIRDVQIKRVLPEMPEGMQKGDMDLQIDNLRNLYENMAKADVRATERDKKRQEALKAGVKPPRQYKGREKKAPTPIMDYLRDKGGIRQGSDVAKELAVYGVTKKTHPDLFNKLVAPDADQGNMLGGKPQEHDSGKYGLRNLHEVHTDNFEGDTDLHAQRDQEDASLVDHEWLLDQIVREANAEVQGTDEDFQQDTLGQILDHLGMDVRTSTNTEIKRAIDALYKEQREALSRNDDGTLYQSAFHGSPRKFDRFSLSGMGTGEGAQAFGWGLYFADKKDIAEYYREALSAHIHKKADGTVFDYQRELKNPNVRSMFSKSLDVDKAISQAKKSMGRLEPDTDGYKYAEHDLGVLEKLKKDGGITRQSGQLYEVEIPETDTMLDWDKSYEEQSQTVKDALQRAGIKPKDSPLPPKNSIISLVVKKALKMNEGSPQNVGLVIDNDQELYNAIVRQMEAKGIDSEKIRPGEYVEDQARDYLNGLKDQQSFTGQKIYNLIAKKHAKEVDDTGWTAYHADTEETPWSGHKGASLELNDLGIKGIKYLDGGSRAGGEGSSNYVVFDDKAVKIIKTFYQGGKVDPRGSITFTPEGGAVIRTFAGEDLSTVLHEFGHLYWKAMSEIVKLGNVPESVMGDWNAMREWVGAEPDAELTVEQEEKIADGFLDYLRRGEAPSADMQGAFSRFKGWLTRLYTGIRDTLPKISPEVKDVFDRMFATDEEIEAIRSIPEFTPDPSIMGMLTKPEREKYTQKMVKQIQDAKERLFREAMRQSERENTQAYKDLRAGIEAQATAQINDEMVYRTFDEIIKAGGLDRKEVVRLWGKEALPYLTGKGKKLVGAKGADPDMMARIMGYSSHTDMRDALFNMKPKKEAIQELTDDEMLNRHGDMLKDGTIEGEALKAYHNNLRAELIHIEMTTAARAAKIPAPSKEAIKARAIQMLSDMVVKDIIPNRHYMAEVKSARAAGLAAGRKEYEKAAVAKGQQLLNHYLYRLALDHREDMDKQLTKWRKLVNRKDEKIGKSNDINFVNAARYILSRHGLGKADYDFNSWLEQLSHENTEENPAGDPEAFQAIQGAISTANTLPQVPYKMMPLTDFQALGDAVDALVQTGRDRSEYNAAGEKQKLKDVIAEITEQSLKHDSSGIASGFGGKLSPLDHAKSFILSADANIARAEHWVQKMDLGNSGPFRKYIWTPIKKGVLAYREERSELMKGLLDLLEPHRDRLHGERIEAPELMNEKTQETYTFSDLGHLLGMIVHLGNPSNRSKLLRGYGWSEDGMNRFMDRMYREGVVGKQDMDLAQSMWNMMKGLKPRLWTAHKEMYGYYPDAVISEPIQTPFGEYEGGYWPARVDSDVSDDGQKREDREAINDGANSYSFPTAGRGALKKRVQQYAAPLQMRLGLLPNHLDWALKFIHVEPAVKDVAKIALNKDFREAIRRIDPQTIPDMLIPYLQRTAKQITEVPAQGKLLKYVSNFVRTAQVNAGIQALGGNLANVGIHLTQFAPFIRETSGAHMAESTAKFLKDPLGMIEAHNEMSPELRTRQQVGEVNPMKEIGRILADQSEWDWKRQFDKNGIVRTAKTVGEVAHDNAYILQAVVWHITDHVGWDAAYNKAMEGTIKGVAADHDAAVEYADSLVRRIQGGHNPEDIANIQMRSALAKIFVFLHGWFNNMGNYTRTERYLINKTGKPLAQRSASHAYLWLMTSVMVGIGGETISGLVRGATPSQNDKYKREGTVAMHWLEDMAVGLVRFKTGQYAFLGPFVNNIISKYTDQNYSDHLTPSPLFDLVDTISRVPKDIYKMSTGTGNNASGAADILTTLGMVTGTPISALKKPVKYLIREHEGKEHPKNAIEFMRGVVGGPAPKE